MFAALTFLLAATGYRARSGLASHLALGLAWGLTFSLPVAAGDTPIRPGEWPPRSAPEGWVIAHTEHYQVQSQVGAAKAERLAEHLENMLALYRELLPSTRKMPTFVLKIFRNREAYRAYGGEGIAHYDQVHKELVCYDTGLLLGAFDIPVAIRLVSGTHLDLDPGERAQLHELFADISLASTTDTADVLSHEAWHQFFHEYTVSWVDMPAWIDEGVGDWFATARRHNETGAYQLGALNHRRLRDIRHALQAREAVSFGAMLDYEQADYYANPDASYAQGWSMVAFLMQSDQPGMAQLIPDLIRDFKRSKNFRQSTQRLFKKLDVDLDQLDSQWSAWVLATEPHDPLRRLAQQFGQRLEAHQLVAPVEWKQRYAELLAEESEDQTK